MNKPDIEINLAGGLISGFFVNNPEIEQQVAHWHFYMTASGRKKYKIQDMKNFKIWMQKLRRDGYEVKYTSKYEI